MGSISSFLPSGQLLSPSEPPVPLPTSIKRRVVTHIATIKLALPKDNKSPFPRDPTDPYHRLKNLTNTMPTTEEVPSFAAVKFVLVGRRRNGGYEVLRERIERKFVGINVQDGYIIVGMWRKLLRGELRVEKWYKRNTRFLLLSTMDAFRGEDLKLLDIAIEGQIIAFAMLDDAEPETPSPQCPRTPRVSRPSWREHGNLFDLLEWKEWEESVPSAQFSSSLQESSSSMVTLAAPDITPIKKAKRNFKVLPTGSPINLNDRASSDLVAQYFPTARNVHEDNSPDELKTVMRYRTRGERKLLGKVLDKDGDPFGTSGDRKIVKRRLDFFGEGGRLEPAEEKEKAVPTPFKWIDVRESSRIPRPIRRHSGGPLQGGIVIVPVKPRRKSFPTPSFEKRPNP